MTTSCYPKKITKEYHPRSKISATYFFPNTDSFEIKKQYNMPFVKEGCIALVEISIGNNFRI